MYRKPKNLDSRITDELFEQLMDIAKSEAAAFMDFGGPDEHMERAVLSAASKVLGYISNAKAEAMEEAAEWFVVFNDPTSACIVADLRRRAAEYRKEVK